MRVRKKSKSEGKLHLKTQTKDRTLEEPSTNQDLNKKITIDLFHKERDYLKIHSNDCQDLSLNLEDRIAMIFIQLEIHTKENQEREEALIDHLIEI